MATAPNNWERLKEIVADALDAPPAERDALLREACGDDAELFAEAKSLVDAYDDTAGVIDERTDAWLGLGGPDVLSLNGQRIGRYRLERVLGEGAMSAVYVARQPNTDRPVALKVFRTALPMVDARQRFRREAQALAKLRHPNIAAIFEAGLHDAGGGRAIPFIAIEYVDGIAITQYADEQRLDRRQRIELLIKVALAVQAAHQQAIIHCDLKPPNVLVDKSGEPRVLDFGIARIVTVDPEHAATWQTTGGLLLGTPGYMSPEQCSAEGAAGIDVRADVWALGVMLYELLLGALPIQTSGATIGETLKRMEAGVVTPPRTHDPTLPGDLETILLTALRREKDRRYASAQAFADDLNNFLAQRPIQARPPTRAYLFKKFARRNRGTLAIASMIVLLIIATTIISSVGFIRASRERATAQRERDRAVAAETDATKQRDAAVAAEKRTRGVSDFLTEMIGAPDPMTGRRDVSVLDMLRQNERHIDERFADDAVTAAALHDTIGWTFFQLSEYDAAADHMKKAVELSERSFGPRGEVTIGVKARLVTILRWQYRPAEAKAVCDAALADAIAAFGRESPITYPLLDAEAGIADDAGDLPTALTQYREVYSTGRRLFGSEDEQVLTAGNNLGRVMLGLGRYAEAVTLLEEVIALREKVRGVGTHWANVPRSNRATGLIQLGRYDEARDELDKVVASSTAAFGPEHDNTLIARRNRADVDRQTGDYDAAIATNRELLAIRERRDGPEHPETLDQHNAVLNALVDAGRAAEVVADASAFVAQMEQANREDALPYLWYTRQLLAASLGDVGRYDEAIALGQRVYAHNGEAKGATAPDTIFSGANLALILADGGQPDEAVRVAQEVFAAAQTLGNPPIVANAHRVLGRALTKAGRFDEAERELLASWDWYKDQTNATRKLRLVDAFITLYTASSETTKLTTWQTTRTTLAAATRPTSSPTTVANPTTTTMSPAP